MNRLGKHTPPIVATLILWLVLYLIYPHYQYYIDPDGTAYLTISKRYAAGDFHNAINGYWSPWSCWLTALLIKIGLQPIPASIIINSLGATGYLIIAHSLIMLFGGNKKVLWSLYAALALFLIYAVYAQTFDDLWECFFLLAALRILMANDFIYKPKLWIVYGVLGTLSYFAKAYAFPFFITNTFICTYLLSKNDKMKWLNVSTFSIVVMLFCAYPWLYALHTKYGIWTTSTAGSLNMSWYLIDHPYWKEDINILIPPAANGSPYYWEDPYIANGATPHFWDSTKLAALQLAKLGLNSIKFLLSVLQLSLLFPFIAAYALFALIRKNTSQPLRLVSVSFLLFPAGYYLINFESRYLWYLLPLAMVVYVIFLTNKIKKPLLVASATLLFSVSIAAYPLWKLIAMYDKGKHEFILSQKMIDAGIQGSMISNLHAKSLSKIAYFTGNSFYFIAKQTPDNLSKKQNCDMLINEIKKYRIKYYLLHTSNDAENKSPSFDQMFYENLQDSTGEVHLPLVFHDTTAGTKVYALY